MHLVYVDVYKFLFIYFHLIVHKCSSYEQETNKHNLKFVQGIYLCLLYLFNIIWFTMYLSRCSHLPKFLFIFFCWYFSIYIETDSSFTKICLTEFSFLKEVLNHCKDVLSFSSFFLKKSYHFLIIIYSLKDGQWNGERKDTLLLFLCSKSYFS